MKNKKIIATVIAMMLVCVVSIAGTLAYLTRSTEEVKNTFTSGVTANLTLDESKANEDETSPSGYTLDTDDRVQANSYSVKPGVDLPKDPIVTVSNLSVDGYLVLEVKDELPDTITWTVDSAWTELADATPKNGGQKVYYMEVNASSADQVKNVIDGQTMTVDNAYDDEADDGTLTFKAYLCQKEGFDTALAAWNGAFSS